MNLPQTFPPLHASVNLPLVVQAPEAVQLGDLCLPHQIPRGIFIFSFLLPGIKFAGHSGGIKINTILIIEYYVGTEVSIIGCSCGISYH